MSDSVPISYVRPLERLVRRLTGLSRWAARAVVTVIVGLCSGLPLLWLAWQVVRTPGALAGAFTV